VETSSLSLAYVDGLDDPTIDRLAELGITNVQNLATTPPIDLTLKTLYPFRQVVDWIDQAILITSLREHILEARQLGILRASDLRAVYLQARCDGGIKFIKPRNGKDGPELSHAQRALMRLARRSGLGSSGLEAVCQRLLNNFQIIVFHELWRIPEEPCQTPPPAKEPPPPAAPLR
jgi:hypothetical protein